MKNLTLTIEDDLYQTARVKAAEQGKSLSRFVAGILEQEFSSYKDHDLHIHMMESFLSGPPLVHSPHDLIKREDIYTERTDALLRRHEHTALYEDDRTFSQK